LTIDGKRRGALQALRYRDFRLIAIGNMVSQLGFWGQYVGVSWTAKDVLEASDFMVTVAFAAQWLPALLLSPFAGVLADRYDRRKIVMLGNLAMVAPPLAIGLLIQTEQITLLNLVILVLLGGCGQAFTQPAASAYVPALVPGEDIHSAIALNAGMTNSTRVIGPALAGALVSAWGVAWGFHINAASFLAVTAACMLVRVRPTPPPRTGTSMLHELRLGFSYTRKNPAVKRLILLMGMESFWNLHAALLSIFAKDVLHGGASTYGLLAASPGFGFVFAAILTTTLTTNRQRRVGLVLAAFGMSFSVLLLGFSRLLPLSMLALGLFGATYMTMQTVITTMLTIASPDAFRGRVMGVYAMFSVGVYPINSLLAGALSGWIGAPATVVMCGFIVLTFNIIFFAGKSLSIIKTGTQDHPAVAV
jgi:MFS family permease